MRLARRTCALVVVLALVLSGPLSAPRGCVECPPGCPMHARVADGKAPRLGCHHRSMPPAGVVCLRSACGHDATSEAQTGVPGVLADEARVSVVLAPSAMPGAPLLIASCAAPEPPTEPPRTLPT